MLIVLQAYHAWLGGNFYEYNHQKGATLQKCFPFKKSTRLGSHKYTLNVVLPFTHTTKIAYVSINNDDRKQQDCLGVEDISYETSKALMEST